MQMVTKQDAVFLTRMLGLLINQMSIYGPNHRVPQLALKSVFSELQNLMKNYAVIEFSVREDKLLVNGSDEGLDPAATRNLRERLDLHKLGGFELVAPVDAEEFSALIRYLSMPPGQLEPMGGIEAVLKHAAMKTIHVLNINYQRISGEVKSPEPAKKEPEKPRPPKIDLKGPAVLDLSEELVSEPAVEKKPEAAPKAAEKAHDELMSLVNEVASLLQREGLPKDDATRARMFDALRTVRDTLTRTTAQSQQHISALANQVESDRLSIASIESAAKRRGLLQLTREELVARYAELNQEIVQPLTVSTGVIDLLQSGHGGALNESQKELLKLAAESVDRVNTLVASMSKIAGLPASRIPDRQLLDQIEK